MTCVFATLFVYIPLPCGGVDSDCDGERRTWGGWDKRPKSEQCYKQERVAIFLSFWLGVFGADHWYAHHWLLAVFKTFTFGGFGLWALIDIHLWIIGGVYGTPGCPGGSENENLY
ncbi:hypothetical protein K469DRAFT_704990 [Zopfia rhizophila CBS 207.26]|uniref:TM2 domain-containing protein n=1 Tax=Zopfia rhizophila CBS 207.26 TaxID=1314779 RepID=A0A6A6E9T3_9PEZI|nr:hypothetical protein K469DRAFT_704990 [Zopfia rhizophila CBS 207.26]